MKANNMAAMRAALEIAKKAICHHARTKHTCDSLAWESSTINANCGDILCGQRDLCEAKTAIQKALSAPPRNCDLPLIAEGYFGSAADKAWGAFRKTHPDAYFDVPGLMRCIGWLLEAATDKKGGEGGE